MPSTRISKNAIDSVRIRRNFQRFHGELGITQGGTDASTAPVALANLGGAAVGSATPAALGTAAAGAATTASREDHVHTLPKLDDMAAPDANTDLNASATKHGLLLALANTATKFLRDDGSWQAVTAGSGANLKVATYVGDDTDDRNITGVGFDPTFLIVMPLDGVRWVKFKTADMGLYTKGAGGNYSLNEIQALITDGFQVGSADEINKNGTTYAYVAFG